MHGDRLLIGTHHYYLHVDPALNPDETYEWEAAMKEANADQLKILDQDNGELEKIKAEAEKMRQEREAQEREMMEKMREFEEIRKKQEEELELKKAEMMMGNSNEDMKR